MTVKKENNKVIFVLFDSQHLKGSLTVIHSKPCSLKSSLGSGDVINKKMWCLSHYKHPGLHKSGLSLVYLSLTQLCFGSHDCLHLLCYNISRTSSLFLFISASLWGMCPLTGHITRCTSDDNSTDDALITRFIHYSKFSPLNICKQIETKYTHKTYYTHKIVRKI